MKYLCSLIVFLFLASCTGVYEQESQEKMPVSIDELVIELSGEQRYLTTEMIADRLINQDPSIKLIDVRATKEFAKYSLPGSVNVPLQELLQANWPDSLDCTRYGIVFFSGSDEKAEQAWLYMRSTGCRDLYIMKGGLNRWIETIITPSPPGPFADTDDLNKYQNRLGAMEYFLGTSHELEPEPFIEKVVVREQKSSEEPVRKKIRVTPKKKRPAISEEGC